MNEINELHKIQHQPINGKIEAVSENGGDGINVQSSNDKDVDAIKKLLKGIQEITRQLEFATSKCNSIEQLFVSDLIARRTRLKDLCEKLMISSPKEHGPLARDKLWRYAFYDVLSKAKRIKKIEKWTDIERTYLEQHLTLGIGQLSMNLMELQNVSSEIKAKLSYFVDDVHTLFPSVQLRNPIEDENGEDNAKDSEDSNLWAADLACTFLLNLGDLCRYLSDFHSNLDQNNYLDYFDRAQYYYRQALLLNPYSGMPHNQLGNLNMKANGGLDSVYFYLCSLVTKKPYKGAITNLRRLLDSQLVYYATLPASFEYTSVDVFTHRFIQILNQFLTDSTHLTNFEKYCQDAIGSFIVLINEGTLGLPEGFLFRVMSSCIMIVWYLVANQFQIISPAVCFSIGIFIHLMNKLHSIVKNHSTLKEAEEIEELEDTINTQQKPLISKAEDLRPPTPIDEDSGNCNESETPTGTSTVEVIVESKDNFARRRRTMPHRETGINDLYAYLCTDDEDEINDLNNGNREDSDNYSNSTDSISDEESEADYEYVEQEIEVSEDEFEDEDLESLNEKLGESSEVSDISYQNEMDIERKVAALKLSQSSEDSFGLTKKKTRQQKSILTLDNMKKCWPEAEPLLIAMTPFMRWLQYSLPVQNALAATTEKDVLERFCELLNIFEAVSWSQLLKAEKNADEVYPCTKDVENELVKDWEATVNGNLKNPSFTYEMPEDLALRYATDHFGSFTKTLKRKLLTTNNMIVIRIGRFLGFGQWLVGTEEFAVIRYDRTFLVPSIEEFKQHMRKLQLEKFNMRLNRSKDDKDCRRKRRKRLKGRQRGLNFGRNGNRFPKWADDDEKLYLVFDLQAVLKYLRIIQKLAHHPGVIIVFPYGVNRELDELKGTHEEGSQSARVVSRWIERNYQSVSSGKIRLLTKTEQLQLTTIDYPSTFTKESREFFEALEGCNYLWATELKQLKRPNSRNHGHPRNNYRITYLTGYKFLLDPLDDLNQEFKPIETCRASHVYLDCVSRYRSRSNRKPRHLRKEENGG